MLFCKITVASDLILRVVISVFEEGVCVGGGGGGNRKNQLNVSPFPPSETDILHIITPSLRGCISNIS